MDASQMRAWAECGGDALRGNVREIKKRLGPASLLGVVKADAYGHGAAWASGILVEEGAGYLAVATAEEAASLREAGVTAPILVFGIAGPEGAEEAARLGITLTVADNETAAAYSRAAGALGKTIKCHLKLDTGMGRLGFRGEDGADRPLRLPGLDFEGVYTHFAVSDVPGGEEYTRAQLAEFSRRAGELEKTSGKRFALRHAANSGAIAGYPESLLDMARPGIMLYGYPGLTPVMELKTRVAQIKTLGKGDSVSYGRRYTAKKRRRAAVIPVGYADGLPRALSGKFSVLVNGKAAAQIGTICMDMCVIDVTDIPEARAGSAVTVFGRERGFTAEDLAEKCGTVSYEILCGISARVPRVYV